MTKIVLFVLCVLVFSTADYFAARWGDERDARSLLLVLAIGPFAYLLFGHLAAQTSLARMGAYVNSGIVLGTTLAGVLLLAERPSRTTWFGLALVAAGIVLVSAGKVSQAEP